MSDLIDRQALLKQIDIDSDGEPGYYGDTWKFIDTIKNMPNVHDLPKDTDTISRKAAIDVIDKIFPVDPMRNDYTQGITCGAALATEYIKQLPSAQPERTCVNCGRTANNGGWYADGRTRCPIEEHYALPKDGYCHLWEKRNVTDDDYPERREE